MDMRAELVEAVVRCARVVVESHKRHETSFNDEIGPLESALRAYDAATLNTFDASPAPIEQDGPKVCNALGWHTVTGKAVLHVLDAIGENVTVRMGTPFVKERDALAVCRALNGEVG